MKKVASIMGICAMLGLAGCGDNTVVAENGDTVVINFEGFFEGVPFDGGKAENFSLTLGSGQFVPGFEEQVVGMAEGEERDINITFPTEYPVLAGEDVVFKVKVIDVVGK